MSGFDTTEPLEDECRTVALVEELLRAADESHASSVYLEPGEADSVVRFRVEDTVREWRRIAHPLHRAVSARIKVLATMDIAERRRPQNGKLTLGECAAEYMVCTLPNARGDETVVLRRLEPAGAARDLRDCGYDAQVLEILERATVARSGLVVIAGPTGSGRATTRYAMLARAIASDRVVMTAEEAVRGLLPGATQIALVPSVGLTVLAALAAIARSDPDVVMVSSVLEREIAEACVRATLGGRLVVCSMHVANASDVPLRLIDMGVDPYLAAIALRAVVAQRLVQRLCERCREPEQLSGEVAARHEVPERVFRANGCAACTWTGYAGHALIAEAFEVNDDLRHAISRGEPVRPQTMRTLRESAAEKVAAGVTSLAEALNI